VESTRLYIKRHGVTGLKYFGKSSRQDVLEYEGSGKYWQRHIRKHGKEHIQTLWVSEWFYDEKELRDFALMVSEVYEVRVSDRWANLIDEDGLRGSFAAMSRDPAFIERTRQRMRINNPMANPATAKKVSATMTGRKLGPHTPEHNQKLREGKLGEKNPNYGKKGLADRLNERVICERCGVETNLGNYKRWHGERCRHGRPSDGMEISAFGERSAGML